MNNNLLRLKIRERLNKLASSDYDNIEDWKIAEAFNKAQLLWVRRQIDDSEISPKDESMLVDRDDLSKIIVTTPSLSGVKQSNYYEYDKPENYMNFKRFVTNAKNTCCPKRRMTVYNIDVGDLDIVLGDDNSKPSFEWGETIGYMADMKFRIYTDSEFELVDTQLVYYRFPTNISFEGIIDPMTGLMGTDIPCEFKNDIVEILIDEAVSILAGDTENILQYQRADTSVQKNT